MTSTVNRQRAERQMDRVLSEVGAIRDDVFEQEYDGARAHLNILRRQLDDLDAKLLAAALADDHAEPPMPVDDGSCDPLYGKRMDSADMGEEG